MIGTRHGKSNPGGGLGFGVQFSFDEKKKKTQE